MNQDTEPLVVAADWVMPMETTPIPNGFVVIRNGLLDYVGGDLPGLYRSAKKVELRGQAILPGLINSHCHLEFSDLQVPIPAGESFPDWIRQLLIYRRSQHDSIEQLSELRRKAIMAGIRESYLAGVRWVVDMTTLPWENTWIQDACQEIESSMAAPWRSSNLPLTIQPCIEVLDISKARYAETLSFANEQIDAPELDWLGKVGIAPHAPYTTSRVATQACVAMSVARERLVAMHLAESQDELNWIENGDGPFRTLLETILEPDYRVKVGQIDEHLQCLNAAHRAMIVHGNFLTDSNLRQLGQRQQSMAIVHCPRTHRHFGHRHSDSARYPLQDRLSLGVRHLLGTDSRASNPDLNLWREAQCVFAAQPDVAAETILKMITTDAAEFLGIEDRCGTLRVGSPAALTAIALSQEAPSPLSVRSHQQAYALLLDTATVTSPLEIALV